jgi:undecaprenyl diphosphate synthase
MDGNGRWAKNRNQQRIKGHEKGAEVVRNITTHCSNIGLKYLTLYAFSTENWNRPKLEVEFLMKLLDNWLKKELPIYLENNVKFETIGDISKFSKSLQKRISDTKEKTAHCTGLTQILALNYGAKDEITRAIKAMIENNQEITQENIEKNLDTKDIPMVDLMIRTSGECRVSNFMLWQIAYAEMYFSDTLWPDFTPKELDTIIEEFKNRDRRFGGV